MSVQAQRILEADRQARWRLRQEQGRDKPRKSQWVITTLRNYLSPDEVSVAHHIAGLWATAQGAREMHDYVDGASPGDQHMAAQIDAMRELHRFEAAALSRVSRAARACMWAIAESDNLAVTARRMGFHADARGAVKRLVQITLLALSDYWEENKGAAKKWNEGT